MLSDVEYNFSILEYKILNNILLSFRYSISMYYRDNNIKGSFVDTSEYRIDSKLTEDIIDVNSLVKYLLEKEKVSSIEDTSIFKSCFTELQTNAIKCNGSEWSITNVSKFN